MTSPPAQPGPTQPEPPERSGGPWSSPAAGQPPGAAPTASAGAPVEETPRALTPGRRSDRLTGIDVARGVAVLGMFVAHLGFSDEWGDPSPSWLVLFDGRSSALFAFLAGVSIALITGRTTPLEGPQLRRSRLRIAVRAGLLWCLGIALIMLGTPVLIILPAYAVMFLMTLPFLRARVPTVLGAAAVTAVISPALIFALTTEGADGSPSFLSTLTGAGDPVTYLPMDVFATGPYPALIFSAYVFTGLAVGRSQLTDIAVQCMMVAAGAGMAALAWGGSLLLLSSSTVTSSPYLTRLATGEAHDYSPVEVIGNLGAALAVTGLLLVLTRPGMLGRIISVVLAPVAAVGAMSLTAYSGHLVAIAILGNDVVWYPESNAVLLWFIGITLVVCLLWRTLIGRGPLEWLLGRAVAGIVPPPRTQRPPAGPPSPTGPPIHHGPPPPPAWRPQGPQPGSPPGT